MILSRFAAIAVLLFIAAAHAPAKEKSPDRGPASSWVDHYPLDPTSSFDPQETSDGVYFHLVDVQTNQTTQEYYRRIAYRLLSPEGVENNSSLSFSYKAGDSRFTLNRLAIHRDGKILDRLDEQKIQLLQRESSMERNLYDGRLSAHLLLEDIRVGDVVDYAYTLQGYPSSLDERFFEAHTLQYRVPLGTYRIRHHSNDQRPFHFRAHLTEKEPKITKTSEGHLYEWLETDLKAYSRELNVPDWYLNYPTLEMGEFSSWKEVVKWGLPRYDLGQPLDDEIEKHITTWLELPPEDRITAALRFIQSEIRYVSMALGPHSFQPYPTEEILRRKFGDCKDKALILTILLRKLGFQNAWPAIVHTESGWNLPDSLPSPTNFDHVIVLLEHAGEAYWLDATRPTQYGGLSQIQGRDYGWALPLRKDQEELKRMRPQAYDRSSMSAREEFEIKSYGEPVILKVTTEYRGAEADVTRRYFSKNTLTDISKNYLDYYKKIYPGIRTTSPPKIKDDDEKNIVIVQENYEIDNLFTLNKSQDYYETTISSNIVGNTLLVPRSHERTMPLDLSFPTNTSQYVSITFPENPDFPKESKSFDHPSFHLDYHTEQRGNTLHLKFDYRSIKHVVSPDEFEDYKAKITESYNLTDYHIEVPGNLYENRPISDEEKSEPIPVPVKGINAGMIFSAFSGFILGAFLIAIPFFLKSPKTLQQRLDGIDPAKPKGIGGWLILPAIGTILLPFACLIYIISNFEMFQNASVYELSTPGQFNYDSWWLPTLYFEMFHYVFLLASSIGIFFLFFRKQWTLPASYSVFLIIGLVFDLVYLGLFLQISPDVMDEESRASTIRSSTRGILYPLIWVSYFMVSGRVKNTFIHSPGDRKSNPPPLPSVS